VRQVQTGPLAGFAGLVAALSGLDATVGLTRAGWLAGIGSAAVLTVLVSVALERTAHHPSPADRITLLRAEMACAVTALAVGAHAVGLLVALAAVALVLDGVDGRVARRTGMVSSFGARFDMEVDAFLILVLSGYVAHAAGWWVLLIGAARYVFVASSWALPWLRGTIAPRPWCKVVAVVQGVVLTVVAAGVLPLAWERVSLAVALSLLAESFGREVHDLWRARGDAADRVPATAERVLVGRG